ncbi:MAG: M6 family metalloprotease domain-containing protein [Dehalococcoidia bacterium]
MDSGVFDRPPEPPALRRHEPAFCAVAPSPELRERLTSEVARLRRGRGAAAELIGVSRGPRWPGFDDGTILPPEEFPAGTAAARIRAAAAERAPLRGSVRVIVVLADFSDKAMTATQQHFRDLFFSTGVIATGSVKEYYREATHGLVDIVGEVVGPYRMPQTLAWYANNNFGIGRPTGEPRANILARDAANAANAAVNFAPYDNDGNGYVDAFVVVHAGAGGEASGNAGDIWSHKWVLPSVLNADGTKIFAYLTVPEDARLGVCAHELGHLLFGFPDLYDTDDTSEGVGNWCLMGGGSWNGGGDTPAHPSAWCKANQGWATTNVVASPGGTLTIADVKSSHTVHRVWKEGTGGPEYFLLENRQLSGFDAKLPAGGLLIWHIDENQAGNTDENHYKVGLVQADGKRQLELNQNRGDGGDPYPGAGNNTSFTATTTPNSKSFAGADTCVSVTAISPSGPTMTAQVRVSCKTVQKDLKDSKETKEVKDQKDQKEQKERKEQKEQKERKDFKDVRKEGGKDGLKDGLKEFNKERKDIKDRFEHKIPDRPPFGRFNWPIFRSGAADPYGAGDTGAGMTDPFQEEVLARLAAIEEALGMSQQGGWEPFIGSDLRPDLIGGPEYEATDLDLRARMSEGDAGAKAAFDTLPPR